MDQKVACQILGVNKGASKEEIRKRYYILSKRYDIQKQSSDKTDEIVDIKNVIEAYNSLMEYDTLSAEEEAILRRPPNPIYKKLGINEKKFKNFMYYYKNKLVIGVLVLITLFSMVRGCMNKIVPDLYFSVVGNVYISDTEILKMSQKIKTTFPDIKEISVDNMYIPSTNLNEQDIAVQQKAMLILTVGETDIVIMDFENYERYSAQGAFLNLDEYVDSWGIDTEKNSDNVIKLADSNERHLYGINIVDNPFFKDIELLGKEKIVAIKFNSKNKEKALEVLEYITKQK